MHVAFPETNTSVDQCYFQSSSVGSRGLYEIPLIPDFLIHHALSANEFDMGRRSALSNVKAFDVCRPLEARNSLILLVCSGWRKGYKPSICFSFRPMVQDHFRLGYSLDFKSPLYYIPSPKYLISKISPPIGLAFFCKIQALTYRESRRELDCNGVVIDWIEIECLKEC